MAKVDVICVNCEQVTAVIMHILGATEFEARANRPDDPFTEDEWQLITHYLEAWEVRVLREKLCRDCQGA